MMEEVKYSDRWINGAMLFKDIENLKMDLLDIMT